MSKVTKNTNTKNPLDAAKKSKLSAIKSAIKQLEKSTKKEGILVQLGDTEIKPIETTPTGSLMFDIALGNGLPKGRIVEFFG